MIMHAGMECNGIHVVCLSCMAVLTTTFSMSSANIGVNNKKVGVAID